MAQREKIDSIFDFSDKALGELKSWLEPWFDGRGRGSGGGGGPDADTTIETTDGVISVDPTLILDIGSGLVLTEPTPGTAAIEASGGGGGTTLSTASEVRTGVLTSVGVGSVTKLQWGAHVSGSTLIDVSTATDPKVIANGLYAFTTVVRKITPTAGDFFAVLLEAGTGMSSRTAKEVVVTGHGADLANTLVVYLTTSSTLQVRVSYVAGTPNPNDFFLDSVSVQQIAAY